MTNDIEEVAVQDSKIENTKQETKVNIDLDSEFDGSLSTSKRKFLRGKLNKFREKFRPILNDAALAIDKGETVDSFLAKNRSDSNREDSDEYAANLMNSTDPVVVSLRDKAIDRYLRGGFKTDDPIVNQLLIGEKGKFFDGAVGNAAPWARMNIEEGTRRHAVRSGTTFGLPSNNVVAVPSMLRWSWLKSDHVVSFYRDIDASQKKLGRDLLIAGLASASALGLTKWATAVQPVWADELDWPIWLTYQASRVIDLLGLNSPTDLVWASAITLGVAGILEGLRRSLLNSYSFHRLNSKFSAFEQEIENGWNAPTIEMEAGKHDVKQNKDGDIHRLIYHETILESERRKANGVPYFNFARSLGVLLSRGSKLSPWDGQMISMDGDSCRQNWGIIGGTGEGKTSRVIIPLFRIVTRAYNVLSASRFGMFIVDPKGGLHEDLKKHIPKNRLADYDVIGVRPEHAAIDLFDGMTPDEVKALVKAVAAKTIGGGGNDQIWIETASLLFGSAAWMVQYVIDKGQEELFFGPLNCRGFSLKGLFSVAADDTLNARIADFIMMKHKELPNSVPLKVLEAANYYLGAWRAMADGTRESVRMSLTSTFGAIVSDEQLCFRFASGVFDADNDNGVGNVRPRMRRISDVLNGAIFGIALGTTSSPGNTGSLVMHLLKGRLYQEANKRLSAAKLARTQLELVTDLQNEEVRKLLDKQFEINEVRTGVVTAIEAYAQEAVAENWHDTKVLFLSRIPYLSPEFAKQVKTAKPDSSIGFRDVLFEMSRLANREYDSIDRQLSQFSDELNMMAWGQDHAEYERLKQIAVSPEKNLCLVVIDEAQEVLSGGEDPICDEVFLAKARETGVFVLAATQSVSHLNSVLKNHDSTKAILSNLTNMIILSTKDTATLDYISKIVGTTKTYETNGTNVKPLFSHVEYKRPNSPANLDKLNSGTGTFSGNLLSSLGRVFTPLKPLESAKNPFSVTSEFKSIEIGSHKRLMNFGLRKGRRQEFDDQRALHDRMLREEDEKKKLLQSTTTVNLIRDSDFTEFQQGVAFVMLKNANRTVYEFAHFAYFSNKMDSDGNVSVYYDPANDDELQDEFFQDLTTPSNTDEAEAA